ncbi:MAG: signal peptide peptidase SppA, partial [Desulfobacteraceae bacterium]|nr:signal peptide peptidase SppA [Desulfobacteraceae bacterium]
MFSRRHPHLFFILTFFAIFFGGIITLSVIFSIGGKSHEFISGDKIGIIELTGVITNSKEIISDLKTFSDDNSIKAIVLRIDSPGGGVAPSQEIFREIRKTIKTKKVIASMGSVAASGGYYVASATSGSIA